ncbi:MAG: ATP-binding cassette domain-containing protein [Proteobacteria bacterium]|nr:ATP-binding cassette domain-containing protein [Pseudomonadota bacterium]MDA0993157.1 ATP-binding cassette domain-containing protein [Pseudomonadota bacterium]
MTEHAAKLTNVSLQRGNVTALDDVSLAIPAGKTTAVLGASGSGKSTLIQIIIGLHTPDSGTVTTLGQTLLPRNLRALRKRIGYAIQEVALLPHMKIRENILLPAVLSAWSRAEQALRLRELLDLMSLPDSVLDRFPHELSGGQQQRAGLCRALSLKPDLLLLDEPFSGLDTRTRRSIHAQFLAMRQQMSISTVLVTHDPEEAIRLAEFIVIMRTGKIQQFGSVHSVLEQPASDYVRELLTGLARGTV